MTVKILLFAFAALLAGAPPLSAAPDGAARAGHLRGQARGHDYSGQTR